MELMPQFGCKVLDYLPESLLLFDSKRGSASCFVILSRCDCSDITDYMIV